MAFLRVKENKCPEAMQQKRDVEARIVDLLQDPACADEGLRLLVATYGKRLYWHLRNMVERHEDADDLMQDVLIKVYRNIGQFRRESKLYTWLFRIATNEALQFLKRRKPTDLYEQTVPERPSDGRDMDGTVTLDTLKRGLALLPPKQKMVFHLRYYEQLSYEDIAHITGTSVSGLKASYHHAVKKLRNYLASQNIY